MTRRYDPSPTQLQLFFDAPRPPEPLKLNGVALIYDCPRPSRFGQDQYRCPNCNLVWDIDEAKPTCQRTDVNPQNRE